MISSYYKFDRAYCPAGIRLPPDCVRFTGEGTIRGLGAVMTTYTKVLPGVDPSCIVVQNTSAVITVAEKGTIEVSRPGKICTPQAPLTIGPTPSPSPAEPVSTRGVTARFLPAVGRGTVTARAGAVGPGLVGRTIAVPGMEFDLHRADDAGAISKPVKAPKKAKSMRVGYTVKATDAVDGTVADPRARPRSGSAFKVGRTKVSCSATDSSGNTARAQFTITVKR